MPSEVKDISVGVIGLGTLGRAVKQYYKGSKGYDPNVPGIDAQDETARQDFVFVCVPTPMNEDGSMNESFVMQALTDIYKARSYGSIVILKSTVVPGTTEKMQEMFPMMQLVYSPEFLSDKTAAEDFAFPDKNIIGVTKRHDRLAAKVSKILPVAPVFIMTSTEAEMVKYAINSYYALKVTYGNQLYDLCEKLDINYNAVHRGLVADKRINDSHFIIFHGDHRGFGGKCLPKDSSAIVKHAESLGGNFDLVKKAIELNEGYKKFTAENPT